VIGGDATFTTLSAERWPTIGQNSAPRPSSSDKSWDKSLLSCDFDFFLIRKWVFECSFWAISCETRFSCLSWTRRWRSSYAFRDPGHCRVHQQWRLHLRGRFCFVFVILCLLFSINQHLFTFRASMCTSTARSTVVSGIGSCCVFTSSSNESMSSLTLCPPFHLRSCCICHKDSWMNGDSCWKSTFRRVSASYYAGIIYNITIHSQCLHQRHQSKFCQHLIADFNCYVEDIIKYYKFHYV